jgi:hypothetical protein
VSLTIELTRDEEQRLQEVAARRGRSAEAMLADIARLQIAGEPTVTREDELQLRLSDGLPVKFWKRYNALTDRRRAETLTEEEHSELLGLIQTLESWNLRRLEIAAELATLRGMSLRDLLKQQGLWQDSIV